jgi:hypothetical protein
MKLISAIALLAAIGCAEAFSIQAVQQPQHHIAIDNNKSGNPGSLVWENCGTPDDLLQISSLEYSPQNPIRGEPITVTLKGQMSGNVDKGSKVIVAVKWGGVPIPLPPMDVCDQLNSLPDSPKCPLPAGDVSVKQSFILPTQTPDGLITALIKIRSQERKQVACLKVELKF